MNERVSPEPEPKDKLDYLVSDWQNGNLADFRKGVKSLTKIQLLELIERFSANGVKRYIAIRELRYILTH